MKADKPKRTTNINIRATPETAKALRDLAKRWGVSQADVIEWLILNAYGKNVDASPDERILK